MITDQHRAQRCHKAVAGRVVGKQLHRVGGQLGGQVIAHGGQNLAGGRHQ
nr:MAG TPA: hypothetical protein [Caudoviricetes sp.]